MIGISCAGCGRPFRAAELDPDGLCDDCALLGPAVISGESGMVPPYSELVLLIIRRASRGLGGTQAQISRVLAEEGLMSPRKHPVTQKPMAYSTHAVSNWLTGAASPPPEVVLALARRSGQSLDRLLGLMPPDVAALQEQQRHLAERIQQIMGEVHELVRPLEADQAPAPAQEPPSRH